MSNAPWDAALYDAKHAFIFEFGRDLLALLAPAAGERILDLGCGTGHLTASIAEAGAVVVGVDASPDMIAKARASYPTIRFEVADIRDARFDAPFDAIFSNAVLHWIHEADEAAETIVRALRPGGRFVAEFGARRNVAQLMGAVRAALAAHALPLEGLQDRWYFPTIGEYAALLERHGLEVLFAHSFDRPSPLQDGERGLRTWLTMFTAPVMELPAGARDAAIAQAEDALRPALFREGTWYADYRRLRVIARRA